MTWLPGLVVLAIGLAAGLIAGRRFKGAKEQPGDRDLELQIADLEARRDDLYRRLREIDEIPGNTIALADISYATNGISVLGQPGHSPLLGEYAETTAANDDDVIFLLWLGTAPGLTQLLVMRKRILQETEGRILHVSSSVQSSA